MTMHAVIHGPNAQEGPAATLKMPHLQTPVIDRSFPSLRQGANDCSVSLTVFIPFVIFRYMSLRTSTSRWITLSRAPPIRAISTSLPRRAKHGEHHDDPAEDSSYNTHECKLISARQTPHIRRTVMLFSFPSSLSRVPFIVSLTSLAFFSPAWRNTLILLTLSVLAYPYLPSPISTSSSPTLDPEKHTSNRTDPSTPYITRLIARAIPDASLWTERNDRHLALTKEAAESKLFIQDAERPKIRRLAIFR